MEAAVAATTSSLLLVSGPRRSSPTTTLPSPSSLRPPCKSCCSFTTSTARQQQHLDAVTVGRVADKAGIVLPVATVSGTHARLEKKCGGGSLLVTDLDSTNGTYINERRLNPGFPVPIDPGSLLIFGDIHLAMFRVRKMRVEVPTPNEAEGAEQETKTETVQKQQTGARDKIRQDMKDRVDLTNTESKDSRANYQECMVPWWQTISKNALYTDTHSTEVHPGTE
ncbi:unnamed protein product [Miscanthus lutarioriparius]|uniref:FHA domain-containing protein n=1 Tax=Miscanthus lutarioriparius TaxID=422564 RepID=A0A811RFK9_9POAL|nr:unnamed protein product [Miscanthus lutarioriparius]